MKIKCTILFSIVAAFLITAGCQGKRSGVSVPEQRGFVNDYAAVFTEEEARALEADLRAYEKETCHQILVLTVAGLQGEAISEFSARTATAWEIGQPRLDNGVLITVAIGEGKVRIEAGSGLDFLVNDGEGERILRQKMLPHFRTDKIVDGIKSGVEAFKDAARRMTYPDDHRPAICR